MERPALSGPVSERAGRAVRLQGPRFEFAVAETGLDFHFRMNHCDRANQFAAQVRSDAVAAAQCRVRSEHAQDSFDLLKSVAGIFQNACRRFTEPALKFAETVSAEH